MSTNGITLTELREAMHIIDRRAKRARKYHRNSIARRYENGLEELERTEEWLTEWEGRDPEARPNDPRDLINSLIDEHGHDES